MARVANYFVDGVGRIDITAKDTPEKYLDDLVVATANLEGIKNPEEFLAKIGPDHAEVYIQEALHSRLPLQLLPDGNLYVLTPHSGFRYSKKDEQIASTATRIDIPNGTGSLKDVLDFLDDHISTNRKARQETLVNVIYFNPEAKSGFEEKKQTLGLLFSNAVELPVQGYGKLMLYQYKTR